jgi:autotransporter-associated beta strand protein
VAIAANPAMATDFYWSGKGASSDNIDQNDNWWSGSHPSSGDNLYFNNTEGTRHWPYSNYGSGSWFNYLITYNGAGGIKWRGDTTYALKFENNNDGNLFEIEANIGNRSSQDMEINPVGSGGIKLNNSVTITDGRQIKVYGANKLTFAGAISGTSATLAILQGATVILGSAAAYTGDTFVNSGTLRLSVSSALATSGNYLRLGDTSGSASATVNLDGDLSLSTPVNVRAGSSGTKIIANTASISGTATYAGNLYLDGNATVYANSGGSVALTGSTLDLKNQTLTVDGAGSTSIGGVLQNSTGSGKLTKTALILA